MDEATKLKAEVYDLMAQIEFCQQSIQSRNQRIAQLVQPVPTEIIEAE